jgi:uncharacterized protein YbcI
LSTSPDAGDQKAQSTAISNGIGALHREHYGRGADRIRTLINRDFVVTTLEDCFTTVEKKMIAEGAFVQVRETRTMFQDWMRPRFTEIVEENTGRTVRRSSRRSPTTPTSRSSSSCSSPTVESRAAGTQPCSSTATIARGGWAPERAGASDSGRARGSKL